MKLVLMMFMVIAWFSKTMADQNADELQLNKESLIQAAFSKLDERQSREVVAENLQVVLAGEEASLRILMNEMDNKTIAHPSFGGTRNVSIHKEKQEIVVNQVSLGELAIDLIKYLVEGNIPLVYRNYFFLTESNAKQWLEARKEMTLKQLQIEAVRGNLKNAEELNSRLQNEFTQGLVDFFKKRSELLSEN